MNDKSKKPKKLVDPGDIIPLPDYDKTRRPVRLSLIPRPYTTLRDTLQFDRTKPRLHWIVPPTNVPLYLFDNHMVAKKLISQIDSTTFVCDGHRFIAVGRFIDHQYRRRITRWLVYREDKTLPNNGRP